MSTQCVRIPPVSGRSEQPVDDSGGSPVRRRAKQCRVRRAPDQRLDLLQARELRVSDRRCAIAETQRRPVRPAGCPTICRQVRAADAPRSAATARRPHSRCPRARSPGVRSLMRRPTLAWPMLRRLRREMRWSPSSAGLLIALKASTPICSRMISTPTWLSVAGPVTTHGSIPKRSRSSLTPPHAATGSFADSTTARERGLDIGLPQDRLHAVGAEQSVAQLEHDDVRRAARHLGQHGARQRGTAVRGRGHDP